MRQTKNTEAHTCEATIANRTQDYTTGRYSHSIICRRCQEKRLGNVPVAVSGQFADNTADKKTHQERVRHSERQNLQETKDICPKRRGK